MLRDPQEGVNYFKRFLRPHFIKGAQNVFLYRFMQLMKYNRGTMDLQKWMIRFQLTGNRLIESWMDLLPEATVTSPEAILFVAQKRQEHERDQEERAEVAAASGAAPHIVVPWSDELALVAFRQYQEHRTYRRPVYLVLDPSFIVDNQLFLTKNGVVLFHGDVPFQYLHVKEQLPTIACNVIHQGRGHSLPPSVTGGSWHSNTTWKHVMKEKGSSFIPGQDIPDEVRITAWEFMGQDVPQNYGRLVFGTPLCNENDFDPLVDSIYGATAERSHEREASAQDDDVPMRNPYEQPSRRGRSQEREEPQDAWEQQRSSSGSSEPPQHDDPQQDAQDNQQEEPSLEVHDDPMGEEVVNLWEAEDPPDELEDPIVEQATRSSISASNPWVLYEAGIVCAREENGELTKNSSGEKVIVLREWNLLLTQQKIALRRQSISRADWEKLPWTGHKQSNIEAMEGYLDSCRRHWTDWMRGQVEPAGWEDRFSISRENWREKFLLYERDLAIQKDMEYLSEAV